MYSDISKRRRKLCEPNSSSASARQSSVLPTPLGPEKMNEPIGRRGSDIPSLPRLIAADVTFIASL